MLIDTHAHLNHKSFTKDLDGVIKRAFDVGVKKIISVGNDFEESKKAVILADRWENVYATIGFHPEYVSAKKEIGLYKIITQLKSVRTRKIVAVGETGLDYFNLPVRHHPEPMKQVQGRLDSGSHEIPDRVRNDIIKKQKELFLALLNLAGELDMPVIIHSRDSASDTLGILSKEKSKISNLRGVMHCFSYNIEVAKKVLDLGFLISFTGNITYKNADNLRRVVEFVPIDKMMLETDCPFLAPGLHRGNRNEPAYLIEIANEVAKIKNIGIDVVEEITTENAIKLFNLQR